MVNRKDIAVVVTQTLRSRVTLKDIPVSEDGSPNLPLMYCKQYMTLPELLNTLHKMVLSDPQIEDGMRNHILMSIGSIDTWDDFNLKVEEA